MKIVILDQGGQPLAAAEVEVDFKGGQRFLVADGEGRLDLDAGFQAAADDVQLKIASPGFAPVETTLAKVIAAHGAVKMHQTAAALEEVTVSARVISRAFSPQTLSQLEIITDPSSRADPLLAINDQAFSTNTVGSADLGLRGNRAAISRTYFGAIPVYEFVHGANVDNAAQGGSIFNVGAVGDVEAYPSNPPAYLAGASGSAVRVLPPTTSTTASSILASTTSLGFSHTHVDKANPSQYLDIYGSYSNFEPELSLNPGLKDVVRESHTRSLGAVGKQEIGDGIELQFLTQGDLERGAYPLDLQGVADAFRTRSGKGRALASASKAVDGLSITFSSAVTESRSDEGFASFTAKNRNSYYFDSLDVSGKAMDGALTYRVGGDYELVRQSSRGEQPQSFVGLAGPQMSYARNNRAEDLTAYAFGSYVVSRQLSFSLGARQSLSSALPSDYALEAGLSATSLDGRHRLVASLGRYFGTETPQRAYYGQIARSVSRQIELDYSYTVSDLRGGVSVYGTSEHTNAAASDGQPTSLIGVFSDILTGAARRTTTQGVELYASAAPIQPLETKISVSSVRQRTDVAGNQFPGDNNFKFIFRSSLKYQTPKFGIVSAALSGRSGAPYTRIEGETIPIAGVTSPVLSPTNSLNLPQFWSMELNYVRAIDDFPKGYRPTLFIGLTNVLNRKNAFAQAYTPALQLAGFQHYPGVLFTAGLIWNY